jgi:CBS domain-containing protein
MSLERFCRKTIATVEVSDSTLQAARLMREHHVGFLVVVEGGKPVGAVTDRDLACRVVAEGRSAAETDVGGVMSRDLVTVSASEGIDQAVQAMRREGVRRLAIMDGEKVTGVVTADDMVVLLSAELGEVARALREDRGP